MAKVIYEFDLNDPETADLRALYQEAPRLLEGVHLFSGRLRNTLKYGELTKEQHTILEAVRAAFFEAMKVTQIDTFSDQGELIKWEKVND